MGKLPPSNSGRTAVTEREREGRMQRASEEATHWEGLQNSIECFQCCMVQWWRWAKDMDFHSRYNKLFFSICEIKQQQFMPCYNAIRSEELNNTEPSRGRLCLTQKYNFWRQKQRRVSAHILVIYRVTQIVSVGIYSFKWFIWISLNSRREKSMPLHRCCCSSTKSLEVKTYTRNGICVNTLWTCSVSRERLDSNFYDNQTTRREQRKKWRRGRCDASSNREHRREAEKRATRARSEDEEVREPQISLQLSFTLI